MEWKKSLEFAPEFWTMQDKTSLERFGSISKSEISVFKDCLVLS